MIYEFWDLRSNNLVDAYDSEDEARKLFRKAVEEHSEWAVEFLMLIEEDPANDTFRRVGIGSELLAYIREAV